MYECTYLCMYVCKYVCMYVCMYVSSKTQLFSVLPMGVAGSLLAAASFAYSMEENVGSGQHKHTYIHTSYTYILYIHSIHT